MKSLTTPQFWKLYRDLPVEVQLRANRAYQLWQLNPLAHGLYFKLVGKRQPIFSVRIGQDYRALGLREEDTIIWFWISAHDAYARLLKQL
jgi:hypothetical protein